MFLKGLNWAQVNELPCFKACSGEFLLSEHTSKSLVEHDLFTSDFEVPGTESLDDVWYPFFLTPVKLIDLLVQPRPEEY